MATNTQISRMTSIASKNGVTFEQAVNTDSGKATLFLKENPHPTNSVVAKSVQLITYYGGNINNNNIAVEQYFIKPNSVGWLRVGTQKGTWVLNIPNSIYALKVYGPDDSNAKYYNYVFVVPCVQDRGYITGYRDYTNSVPKEFVTAFVKFASTLPNNLEDISPAAVPMTQKRKGFDATLATQSVQYAFSFWGSLSGTLSKTSSFYFEFVFYPGQAPEAPSLSPITSVATPISRI